MEGLIHHLDRGMQYCSHDYIKLLQKNGIKISMTEANHCYENGLAERVNGIFKDEFLLDTTFNTSVLDKCKKTSKAGKDKNRQAQFFLTGISKSGKIVSSQYFVI
jgi:transposase InsO family protein